MSKFRSIEQHVVSKIYKTMAFWSLVVNTSLHAFIKLIYKVERIVTKNICSVSYYPNRSLPNDIETFVRNVTD